MEVTQAQFTKVSRFPHDAENTWLHNSKPVWVTYCSAVHGLLMERWTAHRAVQKVPAGRRPWTVDNRSIGDFPTLEAALEAADKYTAEVAA